jgi:hypothetical protein
MAEISIKELQKTVRLIGGDREANAANYLEESHRNYKENYGDIVKGEDIDVKDLRQLFRALAKKVGF